MSHYSSDAIVDPPSPGGLGQGGPASGPDSQQLRYAALDVFLGFLVNGRRDQQQTIWSTYSHSR